MKTATCRHCGRFIYLGQQARRPKWFHGEPGDRWAECNHAAVEAEPAVCAHHPVPLRWVDDWFICPTCGDEWAPTTVLDSDSPMLSEQDSAS